MLETAMIGMRGFDHPGGYISAWKPGALPLPMRFAGNCRIGWSRSRRMPQVLQKSAAILAEYGVCDRRVSGGALGIWR